MGQLHEALAVEKNHETASKKLMAESIKTLGKENLFNGQVKKLSHFDSENEHLNSTAGMRLESTVDENINYILPIIADHWDVVLQKDSTNQKAKSDIVINGNIIAANVPVTFLLGLEAKLAELRKVYSAAHTLPPGRDWTPDADAGEGVYKTATPDVTFREGKVQEFRVVYDATPEHPAQVVEVATTKKIGKYETSYQCGLWSPAEKAKRLKKLDQLLTTVKKARQRANSEEVVSASIAESLFAFINS